MGWTLVDSKTFAFADGGSGHVIDLGTAPNPGEIDILFANSDTVVATPSGFTCPPNASQVSNQGAYGFYRKALGGEGSTVTITTSGNFNCVIGWMRWRGGQAFDVAVGAQINSSVGATTPAITTGALAETGELVVAAALLHRLASPAPSSPLWSSGYTPATSVTIGTGSSGCTQFTAYKTNAGPAAETPSCTWTDGAFDRYAIAMAFTAAPVAEEHSGTGSLSATATLTSSGVAGRSGTGSTSAGASLTSSGRAGRAGTGAISATAALTSSGTVARRGSGTIAASAALTGSGTAGRSGAGPLAAAATFVSTGHKGAAGTGAITAEAFIRAGGPTGPGRLTTSLRDTSTLTVTLTP
ncbi:hypothetical protein Ssi03_25850 [Sphaerisporangium siamense]|uniref:Uncharacterized protein n=1 Tax=Sphaerisporangium siamense TaxID=795645 RepID=A0A7W7G6Z8_9ACTN|nr:hypothetical protein [Sphaerisporangium siamense]MBB4700088.1 hypothetical protein [Sphaerisporangium siamense]GII84595.1 hypothetical protein Ssi03_25850 [Sphaerisporangium siamense]